MRLLKLDGVILENFKGEYELWASGDYEYSIVYDQDGDLFGIDISNLDEETILKLENELYSFDFPATLDEYNN